MKLIDAKCKFCGKTLALQVDDSYADLGDPFKLVGMAACNRCADMRVERRKLEHEIRTFALGLIGLKGKARQDAESAAAPFLHKLLESWLDLAKRWRGVAVEYDDGMLDSLLAKPEEYADVLMRMWTLAKHAAKQPELAGVGAPYRDD
jgi:hypothetical protein